MMEALADGAVMMGLPRAAAAGLAAHMLQGTAGDGVGDGHTPCSPQGLCVHPGGLHDSGIAGDGGWEDQECCGEDHRGNDKGCTCERRRAIQERLAIFQQQSSLTLSSSDSVDM